MQIILTEQEYNDLKARAMTPEELKVIRDTICKANRDFGQAVRIIIEPYVREFNRLETDQRFMAAARKLQDALNTAFDSVPKT